jgi:hypothetical protein
MMNSINIIIPPLSNLALPGKLQSIAFTLFLPDGNNLNRCIAYKQKHPSSQGAGEPTSYVSEGSLSRLVTAYDTIDDS